MLYAKDNMLYNLHLIIPGDWLYCFKTGKNILQKTYAAKEYAVKEKGDSSRQNQ